MHLVLETHDTPYSTLLLARLGSGTGWTDHLKPFQPSTNAHSPEGFRTEPTAVHFNFETHEMLLRAAPIARGGFGVCWTDHLDPFQRSTSVHSPEWFRNDPTAVQKPPEVHETPSSLLLALRVGAGTVCIAHREGEAALAPAASTVSTMHPTATQTSPCSHQRTSGTTRPIGSSRGVRPARKSRLISR
jgi:hypothetical protein